jgi:DNA repair protein RadC
MPAFIHASERPRERLLGRGVESLTDAELASVVLGTGARGRCNVEVARRLLARVGGAHGLAQAGLAELLEEPGVGLAKAVRLMAAMALGRRAVTAPVDLERPINSAEDVYRMLAPSLIGLDREVVLALALDGKNRVIRELRIASGTLLHCEVHPREAFRMVVRELAASVIFVHNHPSGDPVPSRADHVLTTRLAAAGKLLGIPVVDHVVVARDGYHSFAEVGDLIP